VSDEWLTIAHRKAIQEQTSEALTLFRKLRERANMVQAIYAGQRLIRLWPPHVRVLVTKIRGGYAWYEQEQEGLPPDQFAGQCKTARVCLMQDYMEIPK
jgi:hypothetical protein